MPTIQRNNNAITFNRIVAVGCSHTEGNELADAVILKSKYTEDEVDNIKLRYSKAGNVMGFYQNEIPDMPYQDIQQQHRKLSWPNIVAERYGVPLVNAAKAGSSIEETAFCLENLMALGCINLETDLILVGITSPDRMFMLDDDANSSSGIFGWENTWQNKELCKALVAAGINNMNSLCWRAYASLTHLNMLSQKCNNRIIGAYTFCNFKTVFFAHMTNATMCGFLDKIDAMEFILDNELCLLSPRNYNPGTTHGFSHAKIKFHTDFANGIVDRLNDITPCNKSKIAFSNGKEQSMKDKIAEIRLRDPFIYK